MRCPTLKDLPLAPPNKTGWPWTEESPQLPEVISNGRSWSGISIVTPSLNQGQYIEETIRSVLLQGYPNLEYIIIDGGSTDATVEIIKRYQPWVTYWVTEKDRGQSHAINKGMAQGTGEIVAWLNSDDLYLPSALARVASAWKIGNTHWLTGKIITGESISATKCLRRSDTRSFLEIAGFWLLRERNLQTLIQPEVFLSRQAWEACGGLSQKLSLGMDYHLWARLAALGFIPKHIPEEIAFFRVQPNQKTSPATENWACRTLAERAWALYDALRLARVRKRHSTDADQLTHLLDTRAGGYSRVLDTFYKDSNALKLIAVVLLNALLRPDTTLRWTPRTIIRYCLSSKFNKHRRST